MAERPLTDAEVDSEIGKLEALMRRAEFLGRWGGPYHQALHNLREARRERDQFKEAWDAEHHMAREVIQQLDAARAALRNRTVKIHTAFHAINVPAAQCPDWNCVDARRALGESDG